jgi:recombination protein RecA
MSPPKSKAAAKAEKLPEKRPSGSSHDEKRKALDAAVAQLDKRFGQGTLMRLGEKPSMAVSVIPTGSLSLDLALGVGGLPKGRIIEIYGPEASGKTTLALHAVAAAQRQGGEAAFIDAEHALDPAYAAALGVNTDSLLVSQPDCGEQALEIAEALANSSAIDIIVIDSVAALVPRQEIDGNMGDSFVGLQARLMSQALRKLTGAVAKSGAVVIFINQLRQKIGVTYGPSETTTGGNALKFYSSVRIDVRRIETLKTATGPIGNRTRAKVVKNKTAPPFREAEFDIMYGEGISYTGELIDLGIKLDLVQKSGSWLSYGETRLGQGRDNAKQYLHENPDTASEIAEKIKQNNVKLLGTRSMRPPFGGEGEAAAQEAPTVRVGGRELEVVAVDFDEEE